jgi:glycosyltransferase involved in cell wall biosynthesis
LIVRNIPASAQTAGDATKGRIRTLTGLSATDSVIVHCGGVTAHRGIEDAVGSLALLPTDHHLVLIGPSSADMREVMRVMAETSGVANRLHFLDPVSPELVSTVIADADVSVVLTRATSLSHRYSMPNKLFESVHARIPIVAVALPDISSVVSGYGVGEVVPEDSGPDQLAHAITAVLASPERFAPGLVKASDELRWERDVQRMVDAYAGLVGGDS